jgi:hypothetical protein
MNYTQFHIMNISFQEPMITAKTSESKDKQITTKIQMNSYPNPDEHTTISLVLLRFQIKGAFAVFDDQLLGIIPHKFDFRTGNKYFPYLVNSSGKSAFKSGL